MRVEPSAIGLVTGDGNIGSSFADSNQELRWWMYHRMHATLRVTTVQANLTRKRRTA